jgi:hypothetical protein
VFLDIDGVLNRTGYRPVESLGLRSWIEPELAVQLSRLVRTLNAVIVLSSDWRRGRDLPHLVDELRSAGVDGRLLGATPSLGGARWCEIEAWMAEHDVSVEDIAIVDDEYDMGPLASRFVRVSPLVGLDEDAARAVIALFEQNPATSIG